MWIKTCDQEAKEMDDRLRWRTQWIVNDLKLRLSMLKKNINDKQHESYNMWYQHAIEYIEEHWID